MEKTTQKQMTSSERKCHTHRIDSYTRTCVCSGAKQSNICRTFDNIYEVQNTNNIAHR